jgi:capsular polysaccharide biosynthesis protein
MQKSMALIIIIIAIGIGLFTFLFAANYLTPTYDDKLISAVENCGGTNQN